MSIKTTRRIVLIDIRGHNKGMRRGGNVGDVLQPAGAMAGIGRATEVFRFAKIGQHIFPAPPRHAGGGPVVKVGRVPTHEDHGVDRT